MFIGAVRRTTIRSFRSPNPPVNWYFYPYIWSHDGVHLVQILSIYLVSVDMQSDWSSHDLIPVF